MILEMVKKFHRWPSWLRIGIITVAFILPVYFSAFLSLYLKKVSEITGEAYFIHLIVISFIFLVYVFFYKLIEYTSQKITAETKHRESVMMYAYSLTERFVIDMQDAFYKNPSLFCDQKSIANESLDNIRRLIEKLYNLFEAKFGRSEEFENRIGFEVTFMTKSHEDNHITIPAFANREKRAPISMSDRQAKHDIYENTVTASVYREQRPTIRIVENTEDPKESYNELYPEQKKRIKSSIIFPILSPSNHLLGTLVIHCNESQFFRHGDEKYWNDLLKIFSKYLGMEKIKLDYFAEKHGIKLF